jgi:hypothetical protein
MWQNTAFISQNMSDTINSIPSSFGLTGRWPWVAAMVGEVELFREALAAAIDSCGSEMPVSIVGPVALGFGDEDTLGCSVAYNMDGDNGTNCTVNHGTTANPVANQKGKSHKRLTRGQEAKYSARSASKAHRVSNRSQIKEKPQTSPASTEKSRAANPPKF